MKFNLSYLLLFVVFLNCSCDKETSGTNQLSEDQLRHLVGINTSYLYNTPESFSTDLVYGEFTLTDTVAVNLKVLSQTNEEIDTKFRPGDRRNIIGTSAIDLQGRSILKEASVVMKGSSSLLSAELGISTTVDTLKFYCNLNGLYNQPYTDFMTLQSVNILNVDYHNVYIFNQANATTLGFEFNGFKEVYFAKDYGFLKVELDLPVEEIPDSGLGQTEDENPILSNEYKLELFTYFEIQGLQGAVSSTGVAAYVDNDSPTGNNLLSNQNLYLLVNKKELSPEELIWGQVYREYTNDARKAYSDGTIAWDNYLKGTLQLTDSLIGIYELSYSEVKQQISDLTGSTSNPVALASNELLSLGSFKWHTFYSSHYNSNSTADLYATKLGGPFTTEDSLSIHGDIENLLGFELSTKEQKGEVERTTSKGAKYGDPFIIVKDWIIEEDIATDTTIVEKEYSNRVFLLNPNYKEVGSYANTDFGVAVIRISQ